jgi:hypothetical protein
MILQCLTQVHKPMEVLMEEINHLTNQAKYKWVKTTAVVGLQDLKSLTK